MKTIIYTTLLISLISISSCKKKRETITSINYRLENKTLKVSDIRPLTLDINGDGTVDYSFFMALVATSNGTDLYTGVNPIDNNSAKMAEPDDEKFQNMGQLFAQSKNAIINQNLSNGHLWSSEFAYLCIKHISQHGTITYLGDWGSNTEQLVALRLIIKGKNHFGWARLKFDRTTEMLILIDCAWNTEVDAEIKAGN